MGLIAAAAITAVGAGASAYGSSKQASAARDAAKSAARLEGDFADESQERLDALIGEKEESLRNINDTLDRYGGGPSAGSQENLDLLRKTQNDFLRLGAGDFSGFTDQLSDIMANTVADSYGSGAPVGQFTQLGAQTVAGLRQQGISTGSQIGQQLGGEAMSLLGTEFGLLDEEYQRWREIEGRRIQQQSGYQQQAAQSAGAHWQSAGGFLTSVGSALGTVAGAPAGTADGSMFGFGGGYGGGNAPQAVTPANLAAAPSAVSLAPQQPSYSAKAPVQQAYVPSSNYTPNFSNSFDSMNLSIPSQDSGGMSGSLLPPMSNNMGGNSFYNAYTQSLSPVMI